MNDMQSLTPHCKIRVEHGLHEKKKEHTPEWLTELVHKNFAQSELQVAWDIVMSQVKLK